MAKNPVDQAVQRVGGQASLARIIGVKQPTVFRWVKKGMIPAKRVLQVEKITGIPRTKLNPDIYPS